MKLIISLSLSVVLTLLLVAQTLKGRQHLLKNAALDPAAVALTTDLRQALQESLRHRAPGTLLGVETPTRPHMPLPRDPFAFRTPPTPQAVQPPPPETESTSPPAVQDTLRLKATSIDRYGTLAFINDQILTVGQSILGYTVVHIAAGQVELVRQGQKLWLHVDDGRKP